MHQKRQALREQKRTQQQKQEKQHERQEQTGSVTPPLLQTRSKSPDTLPACGIRSSSNSTSIKKRRRSFLTSEEQDSDATTTKPAAKKNCTEPKSPTKPIVATPEIIRDRLHMLQTALKTGVLQFSSSGSNSGNSSSNSISSRSLIFANVPSRELHSRIHLCLRIAAVVYSASPSDLSLVDNALLSLCRSNLDMPMLCKIIAQVARVQISCGVANLPSSRATFQEVTAFNDLLSLCKRNSILERMCQDFPELTSLHYRASHLLLYIFLDSISEKPLLRHPGKRCKALEALQKASLKLRRNMRIFTQ